MLHFFRRIRNGLLGSDQARKYLLYALGEILLVMIGILLALEVNNWNENKKQGVIEHKSLQGLIDDLKDDKQRLHYLDSTYYPLIENTRNSISLFRQSKNIEDIRQVASLTSWYARNLAIEYSTFHEMVNSGALYAIKNKALLKKITSHYTLSEKYESYTYDHQQIQSNKRDNPAFSPFGTILLQPSNGTLHEFVAVDWIGDVNHPTYQAVQFALEENLNVLIVNQRIVQRMFTETSELVDYIESEIRKF